MKKSVLLFLPFLVLSGAVFEGRTINLSPRLASSDQVEPAQRALNLMQGPLPRVLTYAYPYTLDRSLLPNSGNQSSSRMNDTQPLVVSSARSDTPYLSPSGTLSTAESQTDQGVGQVVNKIAGEIVPSLDLRNVSRQDSLSDASEINTYRSEQYVFPSARTVASDKAGDDASLIDEDSSERELGFVPTEDRRKDSPRSNASTIYEDKENELEKALSEELARQIVDNAIEADAQERRQEAATKIQSAFRDRQARKQLAQENTKRAGLEKMPTPIKIDNNIVEENARKVVSEEAKRRNAAAMIIQGAFRNMQARQELNNLKQEAAKKAEDEKRASRKRAQAEKDKLTAAEAQKKREKIDGTLEAKAEEESKTPTDAEISTKENKDQQEKVKEIQQKLEKEVKKIVETRQVTDKPTATRSFLEAISNFIASPIKNVREAIQNISKNIQDVAQQIFRAFLPQNIIKLISELFNSGFDPDPVETT